MHSSGETTFIKELGSVASFECGIIPWPLMFLIPFYFDKKCRPSIGLSGLCGVLCFFTREDK